MPDFIKECFFNYVLNIQCEKTFVSPQALHDLIMF